LTAARCDYSRIHADGIEAAEEAGVLDFHALGIITSRPALALSFGFSDSRRKRSTARSSPQPAQHPELAGGCK
jgi:hypothetical protein